MRRIVTPDELSAFQREMSLAAFRVDCLSSLTQAACRIRPADATSRRLLARVRELASNATDEIVALSREAEVLAREEMDQRAKERSR
jgi:hypothetical protein